MKKIINSLILVFVILSFLIGCAKSNTGIRYVFVDETGKEHNGWCELTPDEGSIQLPRVMLLHSGVITVYNTLGQRWLEGKYDHARPNGYLKMWDNNGSLFIEDNYKNGLRHGKYTWWHTNGVKYIEGDFINGQKDGLWMEWDEGGNETSRELYENNKLVK